MSATSLVSSRDSRRALRAAYLADAARKAAQAAQERAAYAADGTHRAALTERLLALSNDPVRGPAIRAANSYWTSRLGWRVQLHTAMGADVATATNWAHEDTGRSVVRTMLALACKDGADDKAFSPAALTDYNRRQGAEARDRKRKVQEALASDLPLPSGPSRPAHNESAIGLVALVLAATTYADALPSWCAPHKVATLCDRRDGLGGAMALCLPSVPAPEVSPLVAQAAQAERKAEKALAKAK